MGLNSVIIVGTIVLVCIIAFMAVIYYYQRSIIYPAFVFCFVWAIQVAGVVIFHSLFIPIDSTVFLIVLIGIISFTIGCAIGSRKAVYVKDGWRLTFRDIRNSNIFHLVVTLFLLWALWSTYHIASNIWDGDSLSQKLKVLALANIEFEGSKPGGLFGVFAYFRSIAFVLTILQFIKMKCYGVKCKDKIIFYIYMAIFFGLTFFLTGRGNFLDLFVIFIFGAIFYKGEKVKQLLKYGTMYLVIAFSLFSLGGLLLEKEDFTSLSKSVESVALYQFSPLPALSVYLQSPHELSLGQQTFRFFPAVLKAIGLDIEVRKRVLEFVYVPNHTNLYTFYHSYISDFGLSSVIFFPFILGMIHGQLYKKASMAPNNYFIVSLFLIAYVPIILSPGGEVYFSTLSNWIQYIILAYIFSRKRFEKLTS